jgi:hypothetical protein
VFTPPPWKPSSHPALTWRMRIRPACTTTGSADASVKHTLAVQARYRLARRATWVLPRM